MPLLGAANLSLNKAHDRGRQCNNKARADICKQLLARESLDYSPNPLGGWDLARSRVFSQGVYQNTKGEIHQSSDSHKPRPNTMPRYSRIESRPT